MYWETVLRTVSLANELPQLKRVYHCGMMQGSCTLHNNMLPHEGGASGERKHAPPSLPPSLPSSL